MKRDDLSYLEWCMSLARQAFGNGYSPVGAVLADQFGGVEYEAASKREIGNIYHAEFLAMKWFQETHPKISPPIKLALYSTLEPCIMCAGMAAVMGIDRIVWIVDDLWGGASRVYNPDSSYIQKRFPKMERVDIPDLHLEATKMWIDYLCRTGHADAIQFMLGFPEGHQCK